MNKSTGTIECHNCGYFGDNEGDVTESASESSDAFSVGDE